MWWLAAQLDAGTNQIESFTFVPRDLLFPGTPNTAALVDSRPFSMEMKVSDSKSCSEHLQRDKNQELFF